MNNKEQLGIEEVMEKMFDFSAYTEDAKKALIQEMSGQLMEVSLLRAIDEGGKSLQQIFADFLETQKSEDGLAEFIKENIPNFGTILLDELKNIQAMTEEENTTKV